jgi:hypothetical protein
MLTFRKRLSIVFVLGIGGFVGGFNASSPSAIAQVARVTLDSLQTQLNNIVGGTTKVGKAVTADNATSLGGVAAASYPTFVSADARYATSASIAANYLPLSGGILYGDISTGGSITAAGTIFGQSGVKVGNSAAPANSSNVGLLRFVAGRLQYSNGSAWTEVMPATSGSILQQVSTQSKLTPSLNAIPSDNTIPQQTEGTEVLSATITPRDSTSILLIEVVLNATETANAHNAFVGAVFRDAANNALTASLVDVVGFDSSNPSNNQLILRFEVPATSTTPTTFKTRAGGDGGNGNMVLNFGHSGGARLGGTMTSYMSITEIMQ